MGGKGQKKSRYLNHSIEGRFDTKAATDMADRLEQELDGKSLKGAVLDFSDATIITAGGIAGLEALGEQLRSDGKELVVREMRCEMYKALKVAGVGNAVSFEHRQVQ